MKKRKGLPLIHNAADTRMHGSSFLVDYVDLALFSVILRCSMAFRNKMQIVAGAEKALRENVRKQKVKESFSAIEDIRRGFQLRMVCRNEIGSNI